MSRTIENRVVEMQFNNQQFEKAVAQSRQSIQLLEKDLKLVEGVEALKNIDKAINNVDFSSLSSGVQTLSDRFSTLGVIGMSAINTITNSIVSGLIGSLTKVLGLITNIGSTIYSKGMSRASNIEQANFSLQGILSTQTKIRDENGKLVTDMDGVQNKIDKISKAIDASVSGTAYGYDEAAKIASTLVAAYGSTDKGIAKIETALKTTVGLAGQTGQEFDTVSRVMIKVAASGRAMAQELNSIEGWGIGASSMIAEYINSDKKLQREMNKSLETRNKKRKAQQKIDEADVKELASKSKISSDMIMAVFGDFFENAQKANDTLPGITRNIGAALGRLGAAFIEPVIRNEGEWVQLLQNVRQKLVDFLNVLKSVKLPDAITGAINGFLKVAGEAINKIDVKKTKDFFQSITNLFNAPWVKNIQSTAEMIGNALTTITDSMNSVMDVWDAADGPEVDMQKWTISDNFNWLNNVLKVIKEEKKDLTNFSFKNIDKLYSDLNIDWLSDYTEALKKAKDNLLTYTEAQEQTFKVWKNSGKLFDLIGTDNISNYSELLKRYPQILKEFNEDTEAVYHERYVMFDEAKRRYLDTLDEYENGYNTYAEYLEKISRSNDKLSSVFKYPYMQNLMVSLQQLAEAFGNVKDVISDVLHEINSPLAEFYDILTGKSSLTIGQATFIRKTINSISEAIRNFSVKVRVFTTSDNFKSFVKGVVSIFEILRKTLGAAIQIAINAFHSFEPLFDRIFRLIGAIGEALGIVNESTDEFDVFATIVDILSKGIDILANVLISAWDALMGFLSVFAVDDLNEYVEKFAGLIKIVSDYISENWPKWLEAINPYLEKFAEYAKKAGEWLKDKLGKGFKFVKPYIKSFIDWIKDITNGVVDLSKPIDKITEFFGNIKEKFKGFSPEADAVSESISNIAGAISELSNSGLGAAMGSFGYGAPAKILNGIFKGSILPSDQTKSGNLMPIVKELQEIEDDAVNPFIELWEKIKKIPYLLPELWNKLTGGFGDKSKTILENLDEKSISTFETLKEKFEKLKPWVEKTVDWIKTLELNTILTFLERIAKLVTGTYLGINTGTFLKKMPDALNGFTNMIREFNPLVMEAKKADNATSRMNALKDIIKNIAICIASIGASLLLMAIAVKIMSTIPSKSFKEYSDAFIAMLTEVLVFSTIMIGIVSAAQAASRGRGNTTTNILTISKGGLSESLEAIAWVIASIGVSILLIIAALKIMSTIPEDKLPVLMDKFYDILNAVVIIVGLIGIFTVISNLTDKGGNTSRIARGNNTWKVLITLSALIWAIGGAITKIILALAVMAVLPISRMDKALTAFRWVAGAIILIVGGILVFSHISSSIGNPKVIRATLLSTAVLIYVIGNVITDILTALAIMAITPMTKMDKAIETFLWISGAIAVLLIIIGAIALAINKFGVGAQSNVIGITMFAMAAIIYVISLAITKMIDALIELSLAFDFSDQTVMDNLMGAVAGIFGFIVIISLIIGGMALLVGAISKGDKASGVMMVATIAGMALIFGALSLLMLSIGTMVSMIGSSGVSIDNVESLLWTITSVLGVIIVIVGLLAVLTALLPEVMIPALAAIGTLFAELAAVFTSIGIMAILVGAGAKMLADAFKTFIDTFKILDIKTIGKIGLNFKLFMVTMGTSLVEAFLEFTQYVMANKAKIELSIGQLISVVIGAIRSIGPAIIAGLLDGVGNLLEAIANFFREHTDDITTIITSIGEIVFTALNTLFEELLVLMFGEDAQSGWFGTILKFSINMLIWFVGRLIEELPGQAALLADNLISAGKSILRTIRDSDMASEIMMTIDELIQDANDALVTYGPQIIDHISDLFSTVLACIAYALGFGPAPSSKYYSTNSVKKGEKPKSIFENFIKSMWPGIAFTEEGREKIASFIKKIIKAFNSEIVLQGAGIAGLGVKIAKKIFQGYDSASETASPSKVAMKKADYLVEGFTKVLGSKETANVMTKMGSGLANSYFEGVDNGMAKGGKMYEQTFQERIASKLSNFGATISAELQGLFDGINIEIAPGLDLTKIREGAGTIQGMLDGSSSFSLDSINVDKISDIATKFDFANGISTPSDVNNSNEQQGSSVTFIQNNYSPEALNRIDIYRDTKNMLSSQLPGDIATQLPI